jgi:hypothetical protein
MSSCTGSGLCFGTPNFERRRLGIMMFNDFLVFKEVAFKEGGGGGEVSDLRLWTSPYPKNRRSGGLEAIRSYFDGSGPKNAVGGGMWSVVAGRMWTHMTLLPLFRELARGQQREGRDGKLLDEGLCRGSKWNTATFQRVGFTKETVFDSNSRSES